MERKKLSVQQNDQKSKKTYDESQSIDRDVRWRCRKKEVILATVVSPTLRRWLYERLVSASVFGVFSFSAFACEG